MIFISHSSKDHDAAAALHAKFLARDYGRSQIFLDSDGDSGIAAGEQWQQVLYARLKDCRALVVLCTQNWLDSKWCFAELIYAKASGKEIFPVVLEECDFRGVLDQHQAVMVHREGDAAYERLWRALDTRHLGPRDDFGWPPKHGDPCPFPGLLSFDERYAGVYFGRERETQAVLEELRKMRANSEPRLLMITGGSGCGKSSLLKAGVLPQLTHTSSGTEWLVLPVLRYGQTANPQHTVFDQLAMNAAGSEWQTLRDALTGPEAARAFVDATRDLAVARGSPESTVLFPIDQFEELLAPVAGPDADGFLRLLHELFSCANGRLLAIGTLRSDHLDVYERHPHALTAPYFQPWRLGPFPREGVRDVIVKPAARAGVEVTPDLLTRLERDTPTSESLPLLAFTLEKLYRRYAADGKLELQDYEELGGMEGAIGKSADAIALGPDVLDTVRLTFVRHLASVNDKDEVVRGIARWAEIPDAAKPALEQFVAERLLVKNERGDEGGRWVSLEVAHEALFRAWPTLRGWLRDAADILRWRRDVRRDQAADSKWKALRPAQLAVARPWPRTRGSELAGEEVLWIRQSIRRERIRWMSAAVVVTVVFAFAIYALRQKQEAERASQISLGRFLASQSVTIANTHPRNIDQSLLLAIEGYRRDPSAVTAAPLRAAMATMPLPVARLAPGGVVQRLAFSPDGKWLLTGDDAGLVRVWDSETRTETARTTRRGRVSGVFWRPDGERIAAVIDASAELRGPEEIVFWNWRTKEQPEIVALPEMSRVISSSASDRWLVQLAEGNLKVWVRDRPASVKADLARGAGGVLTSDGRYLATVRRDGIAERVHVLDAATGRSLAMFPVLARRFGITAASFRPDGNALAIGTNDGTTRIWDWRRNIVQSTHAGTRDPAELVFSRDGRLVAEIGRDRVSTLRVWNASTGADLYRLDGAAEEGRIVNWARFTEDGRHLVACLGDSAIRVFLVAGETVLPVLRFAPGGTVLDVDLDPTGVFVAASSSDGSVTVWRVEAGDFAKQFRDAHTALSAPKGAAVALLGDASRIIDAGSGETLVPLGGGPWDGAVFSNDGQRFGAYSADAVVFADLRTKSLRLLRYPETTDVGFAAGGKQLLIADREGWLIAADVSNGHGSRLFLTQDFGARVFSPDGRFVAVAGVSKSVRLYDIGAKESVRTFPSKAFFLAPVWSADGKLLAVGLDDDSLTVWSTEARAEILTIPIRYTITPETIDALRGRFTIGAGDEATVRTLGPTVIFDASGRLMAVADGEEIHVYDTQLRKKLWTVLQTGGTIEDLAFSPDGAYLAGICEDESVRIWRMADGQAVMVIPQDLPVRSLRRDSDVRFTADGRHLIVTQGFPRFIVWRPDDVIREACRRAVRTKLTRAEWDQFLSGQPYRETCDGAAPGW